MNYAHSLILSSQYSCSKKKTKRLGAGGENFSQLSCITFNLRQVLYSLYLLSYRHRTQGFHPQVSLARKYQMGFYIPPSPLAGPGWNCRDC